MHHRIPFGGTALAVSLALLAAPAAAAARGEIRQFLIGPVPVGHGYSVSAFRDDCGSASPLIPYNPADLSDAGIEFIKPVPGGTEVHTYWGPRGSATCDFSTGTFTLNLGKLGTVEMTFRPRGGSSTGAVEPGCVGLGPVTEPGTATGTFRVDIDPSWFGRVDIHRTTASIQTEGPPQCGQDVQMVAYFSASADGPFLTAFASPAGLSWVTIASLARVNRTVHSSHAMYLSGSPALFNPAPDLSAATVTGPGGPVTGELSFSSGPDGGDPDSLSGSLRVAFDVLGTKTLDGSAANAKGLSDLFPCGSGAEADCF